MISSKSVEYHELASEVIQNSQLISIRERYFLGVVGGPASGKSTFADTLSNTINELIGEKIAIVVPMDGFHYPDDKLKEMGLYGLKGIPDTFDVTAFIELLKKLHDELDNTIKCPAFYRELNDPVKDAILVQPWNRIVIVEGNYLHLSQPPWNLVKSLLNETWYIESPLYIVMERLLSRHMEGGLTIEEASDKIATTDLPNRELIEKHRDSVNRVICLEK